MGSASGRGNDNQPTKKISQHIDTLTTLAEEKRLLKPVDRPVMISHIGHRRYLTHTVYITAAWHNHCQ